MSNKDKITMKTAPEDVSTDENTSDENEQTVSGDACPECGGNIVTDTQRGEAVCDDCGLVVEKDKIDHGPEWRSFRDSESGSRSRVGSPMTETLHDKGLSTTIGWQDKDIFGNALNASQRERMSRLRTWNERYKTTDSKQRNLKQALGEIDRMGSALGLPEEVRETASVVYRQALDNDLLPGRSIEGVATASLYVGALNCGYPRGIDEFEKVSRVDKQEFTRTYRYINEELRLKVNPARPEQYLPRFSSDLGLKDVTEQTAREIISDAESKGVLSGKSRIGLCAAAIYAACLLWEENFTQSDVSDVADVSEVTIRNRYKELLHAYDNSNKLKYPVSLKYVREMCEENIE